MMHVSKSCRFFLHPEVVMLTFRIIDHCIDQLRQNIMCSSDVTLIGFRWDERDRAPQPVFQGMHQCRSFDAIDAWAEKRRFDIFDDELLIHPTLGACDTVTLTTQ